MNFINIQKLINFYDISLSFYTPFQVVYFNPMRGLDYYISHFDYLSKEDFVFFNPSYFSFVCSYLYFLLFYLFVYLLL